MPVFIDQVGNSHNFETAPKRIVSLVPSQTELLFDLGLEAQIIGITKFCVHPYHLKRTKEIVGGTKKVNFEKIKLLQPDIVICNKEENTVAIVDELSKICPVWVTDIITIEDNLAMITAFGQLFNKMIKAQIWIDKIDLYYREFSKFVQERPKLKVAYFIWKNPYMAAGSNNFINTMLQLNNFENIYASIDRYPEIELKKIRLEGDPDLVFLSSEPYPFKEEDAFEIGRFTHHAKTVFVDGEMFSWYGTRILKSFEYFKNLHHRL
jgi:iron complex transport system substrate-binding protein